MTQFKARIFDIPHEYHGILEFVFFIAVGVTAGSLGLI